MNKTNKLQSSNSTHSFISNLPSRISALGLSRSRLGYFLMLGVSILGISVAAATDWAQWRGPNRDGVSTEKTWNPLWPAEGPKPLWKASIGLGYSSVSVSNGRVYTMGSENETDSVYCFDATTGKSLWTYSYPCGLNAHYYSGGPSMTPTVDGQQVYTLSKEGHLFCLDAATGKVIWAKLLTTEFHTKPSEWGYAGSPLIAGNLLLVEAGAPEAALVAYNKNNGAVVWKSGDDKAGYSSPIAFGTGAQRAVAVFQSQALVARSLSDGHELWRFPWKTKYNINAATPIVTGTRIFISSGYEHGCALLQIEADKPTVLWENKNMRNQMNACVLLDGFLYGIDENQLACIDLKTGETRWTEKKLGKGSLMAADGKLIVLSDRGLLAVAKATPDRYQEIASAQVIGGKDIWAVPVLANGRIYCRSHHDLICLDVSK